MAVRNFESEHAFFLRARLSVRTNVTAATTHACVHTQTRQMEESVRVSGIRLCARRAERVVSASGRHYASARSFCASHVVAYRTRAHYHDSVPLFIKVQIDACFFFWRALMAIR